MEISNVSFSRRLCKAKLLFTVLLFSTLWLQSVSAQRIFDSHPALADGLIVKYRSAPGIQLQQSNITAKVSAFAKKSSSPVKYKRAMSGGAHVLSVDGVKPLAEMQVLAERLAKEPDVLYAEPNVIMWPDLVPNDSGYNSQWHYFEATGGINAELAWDTTAGNGVVVAVVDSGYRPHVDLAANILPGYDFISDPFNANDGDGRDNNAQDPGNWALANECFSGSSPRNSNWHGTHVAGTVAAVTNNGFGVAGVAWQAKVLPIRALGKCGGSVADVTDGMRWAAGLSVAGVPANANPAKVINMSLGGFAACGFTYQNTIDAVKSVGTVVVVSAGNDNINASAKSPANCAGVVAIAASDRLGAKAAYSNFGAVVDLAAPGGETVPITSNGVYSTLNTGTAGPVSDNYRFYRGTSMAAPHVAGVAALLYSMNPALSPDTVETILKDTARSFPGTCNQCGSGILDAAAAVSTLIPPTPTTDLAWLVPVINLILL